MTLGLLATVCDQSVQVCNPEGSEKHQVATELTLEKLVFTAVVHCLRLFRLWQLCDFQGGKAVDECVHLSSLTCMATHGLYRNQ